MYITVSRWIYFQLVKIPMMSFLSPDRDRIVPPPSRCGRFAAEWTFLFLLFWAMPSVCQTQDNSVLCRGGYGNFDAEFRTGIKVHVGAARSEELATRACAAKLSWEKQELVVATGVAQLDLDAFGVDLGDGVPVATFQIRKSDSDCCMEYRIYSLEKPPRLLRTITGGDFFSAADIDLDGSAEIWTHDTAAVNGFDKLALSELDFPPTVVFRFAHGKLLDASAEFQSYFDEEIARIQAGIRSQDLDEFKNSDGKLTPLASPGSAERLHGLRMVKIKVLEIVWAYLYSGREQDAWRSLAEMWPPQDVDRIRAALVDARTHGIHSQVDGTSASARRGKKKHAHVFDVASSSEPGRKSGVIPPRGILLELPPAVPGIQQPAQPEAKLLLDIIVDECGKVRSADPAGKVKWVDPDRIGLALTWKFIPALKDGQAVASRLRIVVSAKQ
jgi:hypothetical protein